MEKTEKSGKWFYTGHCMEDGKTPITVCAHNESQERRYLLEGFKPVEDIEGKEQRPGKRPAKTRGGNERK
ncbi:MAG: hypothetical protein HZB84_09700 [Deltaproteobacteria bacterium]|nr:hypothetical protein [Deltaproteobacteria bacterium]MBI5903740.1 hypothetical protein [Deltaproteobacteria bacterium]